jgi:hypothetical protein
MDAFKARIMADAAVEKISVGDLTIDRPYNIHQLKCITTQYGACVVALMKAVEEDYKVEVFLPRAIMVSEIEAKNYNEGEKNLNFIYLGKNGQSYRYRFV